MLDDTVRRERVDRVVTHLLDGVSRAEVQRWIREGRVLVDGRTCSPKAQVEGGAEIVVEEGPARTSSVEPEAGVPFDVLYEDQHLVVVNKPAGVVVHPGKGNWTGTLIAGLLARPDFARPPEDERDPEGPLRPGVVHRIDKDTSGILVVARTAEAREHLKDQFADHTIERRYVAITHGVPSRGRIETLHGRHPRSRRRFSCRVTEGRRAVTEILDVERLAGGRAARVECTIETGRTHQIRVHLAEHCRAPVLADPVYGRALRDDVLVAASGAVGRQALHAAVLGFTHPVSGERRRFASELPEDMSRALATLRAGR